MFQFLIKKSVLFKFMAVIFLINVISCNNPSSELDKLSILAVNHLLNDYNSLTDKSKVTVLINSEYSLDHEDNDSLLKNVQIGSYSNEVELSPIESLNWNDLLVDFNGYTFTNDLDIRSLLKYKDKYGQVLYLSLSKAYNIGENTIEIRALSLCGKNCGHEYVLNYSNSTGEMKLVWQDSQIF
jgi:hypothetical protein